MLDLLLQDYEVKENGDIFSHKRWRGKGVVKLKPATSIHGYHFVGLSNGHTKKLIFVHKLVAHKYLGERPIGLTVNHKDGCKTNNCASNLEYISVKDNILHAKKIGLLKEPWNKNKHINWIPKGAFKKGNIPWNKGVK